MQRVFITTVALALFLTLGASGALVALTAETVPPLAVLQAEDEAEVTILRTKNLGEAFEAQGWTVTPTAVLGVESSARAGFAEIRLGVQLLNQTYAPIPLSDYGLPDVDGRVRLFVEDATGKPWPLEFLRPLDASRPGSEITALEPGLLSRWTLGFDIPEQTASGSVLTLVIDGTRVAEWDLTTANTIVEWAPPDITMVQLGAQFPWDSQQRVTATELGSLVCGDEAIEPVAHIVTVTFEVANSADAEYSWPGVRYPTTPAIAQWADGSSARMALETHVGSPDPYFRFLGGAGTLLPPLSISERAFVMAAPRDGRFVDLTQMPNGLWIDRPEGDPIWLDLANVQPTVGIDPALCDLGEYPAPVPYAFAPSPKYSAGGEGPFANVAAQDLAAQSLLRSALSSAGLYFDGNGQTFVGVTTNDLAEIGPNINWVAHTAGTDITSAVGDVYWDTIANKRNDFYVITQSASSTWHCSLMSAYETTLSFAATTALDAAELCLPSVDEEESGG